jgi:hypothetical protein
MGCKRCHGTIAKGHLGLCCRGSVFTGEGDGSSKAPICMLDEKACRFLVGALPAPARLAMEKLRQLTARFGKRGCRPTQSGSLHGFGYCRRNSAPHPATVGNKSVVQELYKAWPSTESQCAHQMGWEIT